MTTPLSPAARPAESLDEVIIDAMLAAHVKGGGTSFSVPHPDEIKAAIRAVATWLDDCCTQADAEEPSYYDEPTASDAVRWLRQEADRG